MEDLLGLARRNREEMLDASVDARGERVRMQRWPRIIIVGREMESMVIGISVVIQ